MEQVVETARRPLWRKIWEFPIVAMLVALSVIMACTAMIGIIAQSDWGNELQGVARLPVFAVALVLLSFAAYKLLITRLGEKKHDDLPLDIRSLRDTALGFGIGGLLISVCVGLAAVFGSYRLTGWDDFGDWPMILFIFGLHAGFWEELLMRGILLRWLEELTGTWIALAVSALVFGFLHAGNENATFFSSLAIAIEAGILLGAAYILTRSLWLAIGIHAGWNVVQALWDVPVSGNDSEGPVAAVMEGHWLLAGGGFGLEATIFALVIATGAGVWMLVLAGRKGRIVKPMWSRKGDPITAY